MKSSSERKTGFPARTSTGPPPSASGTPAHSGWRISRVVTAVPTGASAWSFGASVPAAISTAPSGGIGVPPPVVVAAATVAVRSVFGVDCGNGWSTTSAAPSTRGVVAPQAGVNRATSPAFGTSLSPFSGRR